MMGSSQHGHMASIGYDLYCRMLEDTIKLIKGEIENEPIETSVDIKVDAFIPSSYITDEIQKIELYKKIAAIENINDFMEIKSELEDRLRSLAKSKDTSLVHYLQVKLVDDAVRHTNCWYDHLISV